MELSPSSLKTDSCRAVARQATALPWLASGLAGQTPKGRVQSVVLVAEPMYQWFDRCDLR